MEVNGMFRSFVFFFWWIVSSFHEMSRRVSKPTLNVNFTEDFMVFCLDALHFLFTLLKFFADKTRHLVCTKFKAHKDIVRCQLLKDICEYIKASTQKAFFSS